MKKFFITFLTALMLIGVITSSFAVALAENKPTIAKEEAIEIIWDEWMFMPEGDDGTTFPEASFERYHIEKWVSENYDNGELCWYYEDEKTSKYSLKKKYGDYYENMTLDWDFNDDNGNWTIKTPDNFYTFEYVNGMWNQIDKNGDVVDTFPPVSTLDENATTTTQANDTDSANADSGNRVTGTVPTETQTTTIAETNESNDDSSSPTVYLIIGGAFVGLGIGAGVFFLSQKKKG